jgi:hypothetical protein
VLRQRHIVEVEDAEAAVPPAKAGGVTPDAVWSNAGGGAL